MSIQAAYDNWSTTYDADQNLTRDLDQIVTREFLMHLRVQAAIEVGCGTGKNTSFLAQIAETVQAIDFSELMLNQAREKVKAENVRFAIADITKPWAFLDQSANLITCNLVLEHIEDLPFIFSEAARVLVKGGYLFISELHPFRQYRGTKANFQRDENIIEISAFVHHISDFFSSAKQEGFAVEEFRECWHEQDQNKPPRIAAFLFRR